MMLLMSQTKRAASGQGNISKRVCIIGSWWTNVLQSWVLSFWVRSNPSRWASSSAGLSPESSQNQEFLFEAISSYKLSQSVDAPSTRLSFSHPPSLKACQADSHIAWTMGMIVACCIDCWIVIVELWQTSYITMYLQTLCLPCYGGTQIRDIASVNCHCLFKCCVDIVTSCIVMVAGP